MSKYPRTGRRHLAWSVALICALAASSGAQQPKNQWNVSLQPHEIKSSHIAIRNGCKKPQNFQVSKLPSFIRLQSAPDFLIQPLQEYKISVLLDSTGLNAGKYDGIVDIRCTTCTKWIGCTEHGEIIHVTVTVQPEVQPPVPSGKPEPPPVKIEPPPVKPEPPPIKIEPLPGKPEPPPVKIAPPPVKPELPPVKIEPPPVKPETAPVKIVPPPIKPEIPAKPEPPIIKPVTPPSQVEPSNGTSSNGKKSGNPIIEEGAPAQPVVVVPMTVVLSVDQKPVINREMEFHAQLTPALLPERTVKFCFVWGDGQPVLCQESDRARHVYHAGGDWHASVQVMDEKGNPLAQSSLAIALQQPDLPQPWPWSWLMAAVIVMALAGYGTHKLRKFARGAVTARHDPGSHGILPEVVERGDALSIRCVRSAAVTRIEFAAGRPAGKDESLEKETTHG